MRKLRQKLTIALPPNGDMLGPTQPTAELGMPVYEIHERRGAMSGLPAGQTGNLQSPTPRLRMGGMDTHERDALEKRHAQIIKEIADVQAAAPAEGMLNRLRVLFEEKFTIETQLRRASDS
jgi:hypothetical protein